MDILFLVLIILFFSFLLGKLLTLIKLPKFLGPLLLGLVFSYFFSSNLTQSNLETLETLGTLGIIMFLFYIGLELNLKSLVKDKKETFLEGFLGFIFTLFLGFTFSYFILELPFIASLVIGVILSITAEGVAVMTLTQNFCLKTKLGRKVVGAGVIDGLVGILFLTFLSIFSFGGISLKSLTPIFIGLILFTLGFYFLKILTKFIDNIFVNKDLIRSYDLFTYSLIFLLFFAVLLDSFGFDFTIGALLGGIFLNFALHQKGHLGIEEEKRIDIDIKNLSLGFLSYFFYFGIGFLIDFDLLFSNYLWSISFALIVLSMKIFSALTIKYFLKEKFSESILIGLALSSKGGIELIILEIARRGELISVEVFSSLVLTSLILMIFVPIFFHYINKFKETLPKTY